MQMAKSTWRWPSRIGLGSVLLLVVLAAGVLQITNLLTATSESQTASEAARASTGAFQQISSLQYALLDVARRNQAAALTRLGALRPNDPRRVAAEDEVRRTTAELQAATRDLTQVSTAAQSASASVQTASTLNAQTAIAASTTFLSVLLLAITAFYAYDNHRLLKDSTLQTQAMVIQAELLKAQVDASVAEASRPIVLNVPRRMIPWPWRSRGS